eukprot:scaffold1774_cov121-Isochrysis_galbana.AAC.6
MNREGEEKLRDGLRHVACDTWQHAGQKGTGGLDWDWTLDPPMRSDSPNAPNSLPPPPPLAPAFVAATD